MLALLPLSASSRGDEQSDEREAGGDSDIGCEEALTFSAEVDAFVAVFELCLASGALLPSPRPRAASRTSDFVLRALQGRAS